MRLKPMMMLTVLLLGVAVAREAQAFYNPSTGRWLNRDPIGEQGGMNLFRMLNNSVIGKIDVLGREQWGDNQIEISHHATVWPFGICRPSDVSPLEPWPPVVDRSPAPSLSADVEIFLKLVRRWRGGSGIGFTLPEEAVDRMLQRGQNKMDVPQMQDMLRKLCRKHGAGAMEQIVHDSFTSSGAEFEAWYLGGHSRTISGIANCCCRRGIICLEVTDEWNFDEQDPYPTGGFGAWSKYLGSIGVGTLLDLGKLDWPASVPVTGKKCFEFKL